MIRFNYLIFKENFLNDPKMNYNERKTCRLCLQKCDQYKVIEKSTRRILDALLLRLNLEISDEPVTCDKCAENLKESFEFKSVCLRTQVYFTPFIKQEDNATLHPRESSMSKKGTNDTHEHHKVCNMCMNFVKPGFFIETGNLEEEGIFQMIMLEESLPDLKVSAEKNSVVCSKCNKSLKRHYNFSTECWSIERNIKLYCKTEGTNGGKINLNNVRKFMYKGMFCIDDDYAVEELCKDPENRDEAMKIQNSNVVLGITKDDIITISDEESEIDTDQPGSSHIWVMPQVQANVKVSTNGISSALQSQGSPSERPRKDRNPQGSSFGITMHESDKHLDKVENKLVTIKCEIIDEDVSETIIYKCKFCIFSTHYESSLTEHMLTHTEKVIVYQCESCSFETKNKNAFQRHTLGHKNPTETSTYSCKYCSYRTRYKQNLKNHVKKCGSDITKYQCKLSVHRTNNDISRRHTHTGERKYNRKLKMSKILNDKQIRKQSRDQQITPAVGKWHQCPFCPFQSNHKEPLQRHVMAHKIKGAKIRKNARGEKIKSGDKLYQCTFCSFRSNHKGPLQRHVMAHKIKGAKIRKNAKGEKIKSGDKLYQCTFCSFRSNYKGPLQCHMLAHERKGENIHKKAGGEKEGNRGSKLYQSVSSCSFEAKNKENLKKHMLTHTKIQIESKDSEKDLFKCHSCSFYTKFKRNLNTHMLMHRYSPQDMLKCKVCSFQTIYKSSLVQHTLRHKKRTVLKMDSPKVPFYNCNYCSFHTKISWRFKKHSLTHKKSSDKVNAPKNKYSRGCAYKCDSCLYETNHKRAFIRHEFLHKKQSELIIYLCDYCSYQTDHKWNFQRHVKAHETVK